MSAGLLGALLTSAVMLTACTSPKPAVSTPDPSDTGAADADDAGDGAAELDVGGSDTGDAVDTGDTADADTGDTADADAGDAADADTGDAADADTSDTEDADGDDTDTGHPEQVCVPGERLGCVDGATPAYRICTDDGLRALEVLCPAESFCSEGQCMPWVCPPGTRSCSDETTPTVCNEAGTSFIDEPPCADSDRCRGGNCVTPLCTPGERVCSEEGTPTVCNGTGSAFEDLEACADGQHCADGDCADPICVPEERGCLDDQTPTVCNSDGSALEQQAPCSETERCVRGDCLIQVCTPGEQSCDDEATPALCNEDGTELVPQPACPRGRACFEGACLTPCERAERDGGYLGCEFWPVELDNHLLLVEGESTPEAPFGVLLANPGAEHVRISVFAPGGAALEAIPEVVVEDPFGQGGEVPVYTEVIGADAQRVGEPLTGPLDLILVPPGGYLQVLFPRNQPPPLVTSLGPWAWRVVSNRPIVAQQLNPICCNFSFTADATLLLPRGALGRQYRALVSPTWRASPRRSLPATLTVVAVDDETAVTIELGPRTLRPVDNEIQRLEGQPDDNGRIELVMQAGEVLNLEGGPELPEVDLSGVHITASNPIAVFGGNVCSNVPAASPACDHMEHQLPAVQSWGRQYVAAPVIRRGEAIDEATYWILVAQTDGTEIVFTESTLDDIAHAGPASPGTRSCEDFLVGPETIALNAGQACGFASRVAFELTANEPFGVGGFISGQGSTGLDLFGEHAGDPAFFMVTPTSQYQTHHVFVSPSSYLLHYVTVVMPLGTELLVDGVTIDPFEHGADMVTGLEALRVHIALGDGFHSLAADAPVGIVVYGFDDYVGYAFGGGPRLTPR